MRARMADEKRLAVRRSAMKRWLRARGVPISKFSLYNENALRKLVRDEFAKITGNAAAAKGAEQ